MKCNIKKQKVKCHGLQSINPQALNPKTKTPTSINLNNYLYHGIGSYLEPHQKLNRLRAILDSGAILSEDQQGEVFDFANSLSRSPKCNGKEHISICRRQSFMDPQKNSESFNLFISNGISIILDKEIIETLETKNNFDPTDVWEWLDGEYRVKDKIPSRHFIGIGFPCRSLEETAEAFKNIRQYSLRTGIENVINSDWYKDLCSIKSYLDYIDSDLPVYSITSGKEMGDLFSAFATCYNVSTDEVENICRILQTPEHQRIGTIRNLSMPTHWLTTNSEEDSM